MQRRKSINEEEDIVNYETNTPFTSINVLTNQLTQGTQPSNTNRANLIIEQSSLYSNLVVSKTKCDLKIFSKPDPSSWALGLLSKGLSVKVSLSQKEKVGK